MTDNDKHRFG